VVVYWWGVLHDYPIQRKKKGDPKVSRRNM